MTHRSYKAEMQAPAGDWNANGLRFKTEEAAASYGFDLLMRWTGVKDTRAVPCEDDPTLDSSTVQRYEEIFHVEPDGDGGEMRTGPDGSETHKL